MNSVTKYAAAFSLILSAAKLWGNFNHSWIWVASPIWGVVFPMVIIKGMLIYLEEKQATQTQLEHRKLVAEMLKKIQP